MPKAKYRMEEGQVCLHSAFGMSLDTLLTFRWTLRT
jgi:hypothetical protein